MSQRLVMYRGDSASFNFEVKQSNGSPLDVSTGDLVFTVKSSSRQPDSDAVLQKSVGNGVIVVNGPLGTVMVLLQPADTVDAYAPAQLLWDLQYVTTGGSVYTLLGGTLLLKADITRSIA